MIAYCSKCLHLSDSRDLNCVRPRDIVWALNPFWWMPWFYFPGKTCIFPLRTFLKSLFILTKPYVCQRYFSTRPPYSHHTTIVCCTQCLLHMETKRHLTNLKHWLRLITRWFHCTILYKNGKCTPNFLPGHYPVLLRIFPLTLKRNTMQCIIKKKKHPGKFLYIYTVHCALFFFFLFTVKNMRAINYTVLWPCSTDLCSVNWERKLNEPNDFYLQSHAHVSTHTHRNGDHWGINATIKA